jgi:competence ComEA-like helix-hairpin-helix protein
VRWVLLSISILSVAAVVQSAATDDDLPEGQGKEAVQKMCANCHALKQVTETRRSGKEWIDLVDDMVSRGAEGSDEEVSAVTKYLARNFGKPVNINTSTAKEIEDDLSFSANQAESIVRYRTEKGLFKNLQDLSQVPGIDATLLEEQKKNIVF